VPSEGCEEVVLRSVGILDVVPLHIPHLSATTHAPGLLAPGTGSSAQFPFSLPFPLGSTSERSVQCARQQFDLCSKARRPSLTPARHLARGGRKNRWRGMRREACACYSARRRRHSPRTRTEQSPGCEKGCCRVLDIR